MMVFACALERTVLVSLSGGLGGLVCTVLVSLLDGGVATVGDEIVVAVVLAPLSLSKLGLCALNSPSVTTLAAGE